ncbi:MAG TPA: hypothetical protein VFV72_11785 [Candidatus Limnocylindrales bacterium]|nr:hypothetical protein [Candidatus Limnocylindrales bacterium]
MTSDADLDRLLTVWLSGGGPDRSPDWVAADALEQVDTLPQRRPRRWFPTPASLRSQSRRSWAIAAAVAALTVAAVALGIGAGADLRTPDPSPTPPPDSVGWRPLDGSFEVLLPPRWKPASGSDPGAIYAIRTSSDGSTQQLSIRRADDRGAIRRCDRQVGRWEECGLTSPRTLDELVTAVVPNAHIMFPGEAKPSTNRSRVILDGEMATVVNISLGGPPPSGQVVVYIAAFHGGRAYLIRGWTDADATITGLKDVVEGLRFLPDPERPDPSPPRAMRGVAYPDHGIEFAVPESWPETQNECCDRLAFAGHAPEGMLSVSHGHGYGGQVCLPLCVSFEASPLPDYDPGIVVDELTAQISGQVGPGTWLPLPFGAVPDLIVAQRLSRSVYDQTIGSSTSETYVVGVHDDRVLIVAFQQPGTTGELDLVDRTLASIRFLPAKQGPTDEPSPDGFGRHTAQGGVYSLELPDGWWPGRPFEIEGLLPIEMRRYGEDALTISLGTEGGRVAYCNPVCGLIAKGQRSIDDLEQTLTGGDPNWTAEPGDVDGLPSRILRPPPGADPQLEHIVFMFRERRPAIITINHKTATAPPDVYARIIDSIRFAPPPEAPELGLTLVAPDGSFRADLAEGWGLPKGRDPAVAYAARGGTHLEIRVGDQRGHIRPCDPDTPRSGWETCDEAVIQSVEDVGPALALHPISYGPLTTWEDVVLDGEPAVIQFSSGYEYPARGGQNLAYVAAVHNGRPYVLRFWTSASTPQFYIEEVIDGFHFTD